MAKCCLCGEPMGDTEAVYRAKYYPMGEHEQRVWEAAHQECAEHPEQAAVKASAASEKRFKQAQKVRTRLRQAMVEMEGERAQKREAVKRRLRAAMG